MDRKNQIFRVGDMALIHNEYRRKKIDEFFTDLGVIIENEYGDVYKVQKLECKTARNHESKLKRLEEGKLDRSPNDPVSNLTHK